jgi:DNA-binding SARP family transcriptional activator
MRFRLLGPLRVRNGGVWSAVGAPQQRAVLAVLLLARGRLTTMEGLIHELWGDRPPRTATTTIHGYVGRLRRMLGGGGRGPLVTRDRGYEMVMGTDDLDADVFDRLVSAARRDLVARRFDEAAGQLAEGLGLWQGPAMSDVPVGPRLTVEAARLEQRRLTAIEARLAADLELGRHAEAVEELQRLADEHPFREGLHAQLMLALYRCGRRAEALAAYQRGRRALVAELGLEPGRELRELHRAILADAPTGGVVRR